MAQSKSTFLVISRQNLFHCPNEMRLKEAHVRPGMEVAWLSMNATVDGVGFRVTLSARLCQHVA